MVLQFHQNEQVSVNYCPVTTGGDGGGSLKHHKKLSEKYKHAKQT